MKMLYIDARPTSVADMPLGTVFAVPGVSPYFMRCQGGGFPAVVRLFAANDEGPQFIPEAGPRYGAPLPRTSFRVNAEQYTASFEGGRPSTQDWCVVNADGTWFRTGNMWLDLSSGELSDAAPRAPWFANAVVGFCKADDPDDAEPYKVIGLDVID
jgi:hypothetical protein